MRLLARLLEWLGILLYHVGAARLVIRARPDALRVLLYHACQPAEDPFIAGLSSNTTPVNFAAQMAFVARHYTVIPVDAIDAPDRPRCAAVITFDDGYRSVLEGAAPVLQRHGLPYTVYLVSDVVGNQRMVWANELNALMRRNDEVRTFVASTLGLDSNTSPEALIDAARRTFDPRRMDEMLVRARTLTGVDAQPLAEAAQLYLTWDEIRAMRTCGASFGNHTRTHPSLPRLTPAQLSDELVAAHEAITRQLGRCDSFAHPFGDRSNVACDELRRMGYRSIMNVGGAQRPVRPDAVARIPAPDAGAARLFAIMEIVEPAKAGLRRLLRRR